MKELLPLAVLQRMPLIGNIHVSHVILYQNDAELNGREGGKSSSMTSGELQGPEKVLICSTFVHHQTTQNTDMGLRSTECRVGF